MTGVVNRLSPSTVVERGWWRWHWFAHHVNGCLPVPFMVPGVATRPVHVC
jgi:hypothetical protein